MVNAPIVQTIHMHAEANRHVKYTATPLPVETLAVFLPSSLIFHRHHRGWSLLVHRYVTGGFYSQVSLPRVTVNAVALALALIGRMNFQYLILAGPPNCDRQMVFLLPFLSLYTFIFQ